MSGVVTRSQSQGDKEDNMESASHDTSGNKNSNYNKNVKQTATNSNANQSYQSEDESNQELISNPHINKQEIKQTTSKKGVKASKNADAINRSDNQHVVGYDHDKAETNKGYVAERVEKLNSNPSTPVQASKMPKAKSSMKNRTLISQNGQLSMQGAQGFTSVLSQKLNEIETQQQTSQEHDLESDLTSILKELASSVKKLEGQLSRMESERKRTDQKVSAVEVIQQQESVKLRGVIDQIDDHDEKLQMLVGMVVRQDQQIQALTSQINSAHASRCHKNIIINGIVETQGENTIHEVAHFLKQTLKIQAKISIKFARRMGKGQYKPMLVKLQNANDKAVIFQNLDKLREINKSKDRPFFVTDHLPEAWAKRKRFFHHLKQQNRKLPQDQRYTTQVKDNNIFFNDQEFKPLLTVPTVSQFLGLSKERKRIIRDLQVIAGGEDTQKESIFISYASQVFSAKEAENYYYHVRLINPEATHLMCAFRLPGSDFIKSQGYVDDGEHGGGRLLMRLLNNGKHNNCAVFMARYYGGTHLGQQRFSIIEKVALIALKNLSTHVIQMRRPPTQQELDDYRRNNPEPFAPPRSWAEMTDEEEVSQGEDSQQDSLEEQPPDSDASQA